MKTKHILLVVLLNYLWNGYNVYSINSPCHDIDLSRNNTDVSFLLFKTYSRPEISDTVIFDIYCCT